MVDLIRSFLSQALKTNERLDFAVLTGCLRIAMSSCGRHGESIFTGLNNFNVCSISDSGCAEYFGFMDSEVKEMLRYYGAEDCFFVYKRMV